MPHAFSRRLGQGPLLCDGAMGTVLYARGVSLDACFDVLNLNQPAIVQSVHGDYVAAGADCLETNTFGANRFKLAVHGLEAGVREINRAGARLARDVRESTGRDVYVLGSIGPLGKYLAPLGTISTDEASVAFHEQAEALLEGGVDGFVLETFSDLTEIALAVEAVRAVTDLPVVAEMAFTDEGVTFTGHSPEEVARHLRGLGVEAFGANCSVGSSVLFDVLERRLDAGEFVVTVELDPPRGHTVDKLVQGAKLLKERGVEIVDINDGSLGRVRMSVLATALLVRDGTGLDVNMHFTCRDRNLMGMQADLLGAHALDIRNILAMTGDPPRAGDYANATAVFDVDGVGLIGILRRMNEGLDATGSSIGDPTAFCIGAALNPAAEDPDRELERMHRKIEAGASWLQTQPVYDLEALERFLARAGRIPVPVLVGILPLHSSRHAEFLHNEVPGITVPDAVRARLRDAGESALRAGIEMAQALVAEVRRRHAGAYLMPSFGRFEVVAEVLDALH